MLMPEKKNDKVDIREEEVSNDQEKCRTSHKDIVVILMNIGKSTGPSLGDCLLKG